MTFEQIDYFIGVVEARTFFDAAENFHITQSALSKQIMKLEKELNVRLLDRTRRSAALTEEGAMFYEEAKILSRQYHHALARVQGLQKSREEKLRIGTLPILSQYKLTALLKNFSDFDKKTSLSIEEAEEQDLLKGFSEDKFQLIIARSHMLDLKKCDFYPLAKDQLVVILPSDHFLAKRASLTAKSIGGQPFIWMPPYTSIHQLSLKLFSQAGINPRLVRTARMESIISAVAVHEGISLLPEKNFRLFQWENLVSVPLCPPVELSVGIAGKKSMDRTEGVKSFLSYLSNISPPDHNP